MNYNSIINDILYSHKNYNQKNIFENAVKNAFEYLGFDTEVKNNRGNTNIVTHSNIGSDRYTMSIFCFPSKRKLSSEDIQWSFIFNIKQQYNIDYSILVSPEFNIDEMFENLYSYKVLCITTNELLDLIKKHKEFPLSLIDLKNAFKQIGFFSEYIKQKKKENEKHTSLLKNLKLIVKEMYEIQKTSLGYFTAESIVTRPLLIEKNVELNDINFFIDLLKNPLIKAIKEKSENHFILIEKQKNIAETLSKLSQLLEDNDIIAEKNENSQVINTSISTKNYESKPPLKLQEKNTEVPIEEKKEVKIHDLTENKDTKNDNFYTEIRKEVGTRYYKWEQNNDLITVFEKNENTDYKNECSIEEFEYIMGILKTVKKDYGKIKTDKFEMYIKSKNNTYEVKTIKSKIPICLGVLEIAGILDLNDVNIKNEYVCNDISKIDIFINELKKKI